MPGRVWLVTSRLGTGKSLTIFYSECQNITGLLLVRTVQNSREVFIVKTSKQLPEPEECQKRKDKRSDIVMETTPKRVGIVPEFVLLRTDCFDLVQNLISWNI